MSITGGVLGIVTGCGPAAAVRPGDIRSYALPKDAEPSPVAAPSATVADGDAPRSSGRLRYEVPDGWTDGEGGSGMRLATVFIGPPSDRLEVTVIPASGTLEGNVVRWQGQLLAEATPDELRTRASAALAAAETVEVDGVTATVVLLRDAETNASGTEAGQAILGAMIPVADRRALFVKFKGDAAVALREREGFKRFVASIRREE